MIVTLINQFKKKSNNQVVNNLEDKNWRINSSKEKYSIFCNEQPIPLYSQPWWLDSVCGSSNWEILILENDNKIIASWPLCFRKKFDFKCIMPPKFTPMLGIWIDYPSDQNYTNRLSFELKVCETMISALPKYDMFLQGFNYSFTNWLPFYWDGYKQMVRYSYVIEDLSSTETLFNNFTRTKRTNIRKAQQIVNVKYDLGAREFYDFHRLSLSKMGEKISYSFDVFKRMYDGAYKFNKGSVLYAVDEKNNVHSVLFVVWDKTSAYSLISSTNPDYKSSYSLALLFFEAMKMTSAFVNKFDFEGSTIRNVEVAYRHFGAVQKPFFQLFKINSKLMRLLLFVRSEIKPHDGSFL